MLLNSAVRQQCYRNKKAASLSTSTGRFLFPGAAYSTVTLFAKLRGWSTSHPRRTAM